MLSKYFGQHLLTINSSMKLNIYQESSVINYKFKFYFFNAVFPSTIKIVRNSEMSIFPL